MEEEVDGKVRAIVALNHLVGLIVPDACKRSRLDDREVGTSF